MSDVNALYQNGAGSLASLFAGQNQSSSQAQQAADLASTQQMTDQRSQMLPLEMQLKQAQLAQMGAELPGIQGHSRSLAATGDEDQQVMSEKVASKIASLRGNIGDEHIKTMGQDGEKISMLAAMSAQYPPGSQKAAFMSGWEKYGGDPNSPLIQSVMQAPDGEFAKGAAAIGQGMSMASRKFIQESSLKTAENNSQERINKATNESHERIAAIQADAKKMAANSRSATAMSHMSIDQAIAYLSGIPEKDRTDDEQARLVQLSKQQLAARAAGAPATPAQVLGNDTPTANATKTAQDIFNKNTPASGTTPPANIQDAVTRAGWSYEPDKYEYRQDEHGVAQRRPKTKK